LPALGGARDASGRALAVATPAAIGFPDSGSIPETMGRIRLSAAYATDAKKSSPKTALSLSSLSNTRSMHDSTASATSTPRNPMLGDATTVEYA